MIFLLYCIFLSWSFLFQNVDDAYISFRYGKNLMEGNGLVYNKGEYIEGYTNFLWTVVTAPFTIIKEVDISKFALVLGFLISVANVYLVSLISRQFFDIFSLAPSFFVLLPSLFFVLDDSVAFWAIGGMEFPLYTLFILLVIYYYFRLNDNPENIYSVVLFLMLTTLTRPEGNMIFFLVFLHMVFFRKKINDFRGKIIKLILIYVLFCFIYYGFKYLYYGQIIPNTFYAKGVTDVSMNLLLGLKYLALCVGTRFHIFIFIIFIPFKKVFKDFRQSLLLFFSFVYVLYLVFVGGDWMIANRFFVPVIPVFYILGSIGLITILGKLWKFGRLAPGSLTLKLLLVGLCATLFSGTLAFLEYKQLIIKDDNAKYELQWSMFGKWLNKNVPANTVIAVGPAGKIPYYSELYTIDMWGLNNEVIAKKKSVRLQAGHKKFDFDYVLSLNPEFIIGYAGFTDEEMPARYEKFNAPEEEYKSFDVVFRLKEEYRKERY